MSFYQAFATSFGAVLPTLILLCLGIVLRRKLSFSADFWSGLEKLVYYIFFPILLTHTTLRAELSIQYAWLIAAALFIMLSGIFLSWVGLFFSRAPAPTRHAIFQCGFRFNTYVGIAVVSAGLGVESMSIFALIIAISVPLANIAAVTALTTQSGTPIWREIFRNPLVIGIITGILGNLLGVKLPHFLDHTFSLISNSAIVLGLIAVGAALQFESFGYYRRLNGYFLILKLFLLPILTLLALKFLFPSFSTDINTMFMIFASLPTASSAYILSMQMGGDGKTVALQITVGSIVSMLTIPTWMMVARSVL